MQQIVFSALVLVIISKLSYRILYGEIKCIYFAVFSYLNKWWSDTEKYPFAHLLRKYLYSCLLILFWKLIHITKLKKTLKRSRRPRVLIHSCALGDHGTLYRYMWSQTQLVVGMNDSPKAHDFTSVLLFLFRFFYARFFSFVFFFQILLFSIFYGIWRWDVNSLKFSCYIFCLNFLLFWWPYMIDSKFSIQLIQIIFSYQYQNLKFSRSSGHGNIDRSLTWLFYIHIWFVIMKFLSISYTIFFSNFSVNQLS